MRGTVVVTMQYGTAGVLVGGEAGKRRGLPFLDDLMNLRVGRGITGCPGNDATRIPPFMPARVGNVGDQARITAQYRHLGTALALVVARLEQIPHSTAGAALAVPQKLYVHGASSVPESSSA